MDGPDCNRPSDCQLRLAPHAARPEHIASTARGLAASPAQRSLSRAVYREEYEQSLHECMAGGSSEGRMHMVGAHNKHVEGVRNNPPLNAFVDALRAHKESLLDE